MLKEFLLKGLSFNEILKQFAVERSAITIKDEEVLLNGELQKKEILKEWICIQGQSVNGIINFFGTLHCNIANQLAVFELEFVERNSD